MDDKEFKRMNMYNQRINEVNNEKYSKYKVKKNEKEPKTAIWWAIMRKRPKAAWRRLP